MAVLHAAESKAKRLKGSATPQAAPAQGIYNLLGEAYSALNDSAKAEHWFKVALAFKPDHLPAFLTYGKLLAKNVSKIIRISIQFQNCSKAGVEKNSFWELALIYGHRK